MHFHYVDIGTSNFGTSAKHRKPDENLLLVEPLQFYLNDLPNHANIYKANFAISDKEYTTTIFYVPPTDITRLGLPAWVRGCNSINDYHPTVKKVLGEMNIPLDVVQKQETQVISFKTLIDKYDIDAIDSLKIDTEGHDHVILENVLNTIDATGIEITQIVVEYHPAFKNTEQIDALFARAAETLGYTEFGINKANKGLKKIKPSV
jgi:hypothetical protein